MKALEIDTETTSTAGRKFEPIRWTLERASREFGLDKKTLSGRVKRQGELPGEDGRWSTQQMVRAIYDDLEFERIRKTRAEADGQEMLNRKTAGELVDLEQLASRLEPVMIEMKRIVLSSGLKHADQDRMLGELARAFELK